MPATPPLILLPPSEGKAPGGTTPPWEPGSTTHDGLDDRRLIVLRALAAAMRKPVASRAKLLGVKGVALAEATAVDLTAAQSPTMPAIDRYTGVLYDALDVTSLTPRSRRRLHDQVRILSGLWGVVAPDDLIPNYKLKMGATIGRPGKLSTWWRPAVTSALAPEVAGRVVWDLLPNEHRLAWAPPTDGPDAPCAVISVTFADEVQRGETTELVAVAHWNKLLKGALVRHVIEEQVSDPDTLADFDHPLGYRYEPARTSVAGTLTRLTFVKPLVST